MNDAPICSQIGHQWEGHIYGITVRTPKKGPTGYFDDTATLDYNFQVRCRHCKTPMIGGVTFGSRSLRPVPGKKREWKSDDRPTERLG